MSTELSYKNFYFIYTVVGPSYIKTVLQSLKSAPRQLNAVIVTNTPELVNTTGIACNVIAVDIESLRDDVDRKNEPLLKYYDEDEYIRMLASAYRGSKSDIEQGLGYRFPAAIMRHSIKWALLHNVTNFALLDVGCYINPNFERVLDFWNNKILTKAENIVFGRFNRTDEESETHSLYNRMKNLEFYVPGTTELFLKEGIKIKPSSPTFTKYGVPNSTEEDAPLIQKTGEVDLDGFMLGFLCTDREVLKKYYRLWNNMTRLAYQYRTVDTPHSYPLFNGWVVGFEWCISLITEILSKYDGLAMTVQADLVMHKYRPEVDCFATNFRFPNGNFIQSESRSEFIQLNKTQLLNYYGPHLCNLLLYGWES